MVIWFSCDQVTPNLTYVHHMLEELWNDAAWDISSRIVMTIVRMLPLYRLGGTVFVFVVFFCMTGKIINCVFYILMFMYMFGIKKKAIYVQ